MKSLWTELNKLYKKRYKWDYYNSVGIEINPLENPEYAYQFIRNYFEHGSKRNLMDFDRVFATDNYELHESHTVIMFFLGIKLFQQFSEELKIVSNYGEYPFPYLWYLCCLMHDIGYQFDRDIDLDNPEYSSTKEVIEDGLKEISQLIYERDMKTSERIKMGKKRAKTYLKICSDIYSSLGMNIKRNSFNKFEFGIRPRIRNNQHEHSEIKYTNGNRLKNQYSDTLLCKYLIYAIKNKYGIDHGIAGADYFIGRMYENYDNQYERNRVAGEYHNFINNDNNNFSIDQFDLFIYIANCIASHNVWKAQKGSEDLYKEIGLLNLVGGRFKKINYKSNPLLFVLCLVDSVEPTKKFKSRKVLEDIEMQFENNTLNIKLNKSLSSTEIGEKYIASLKEISDWIDVTINII